MVQATALGKSIKCESNLDVNTYSVARCSCYCKLDCIVARFRLLFQIRCAELMHKAAN